MIRHRKQIRISKTLLIILAMSVLNLCKPANDHKLLSNPPQDNLVIHTDTWAFEAPSGVTEFYKINNQEFFGRFTYDSREGVLFGHLKSNLMEGIYFTGQDVIKGNFNFVFSNDFRNFKGSWDYQGKIGGWSGQSTEITASHVGVVNPSPKTSAEFMNKIQCYKDLLANLQYEVGGLKTTRQVCQAPEDKRFEFSYNSKNIKGDNPSQESCLAEAIAKMDQAIDELQINSLCRNNRWQFDIQSPFQEESKVSGVPPIYTSETVFLFKSTDGWTIIYKLPNGAYLGRYTFGKKSGAFYGIRDQNTLTGQYQTQGDETRGEFRFEFDNNLTQFSGTWMYQNKSGPWMGHRVPSFTALKREFDQEKPKKYQSSIVANNINTCYTSLVRSLEAEIKGLHIRKYCFDHASLLFENIKDYEFSVHTQTRSKQERSHEQCLVSFWSSLESAVAGLKIVQTCDRYDDLEGRSRFVSGFLLGS